MIPDVNIFPLIFKAMAFLLLILYSFFIVVIAVCIVIAGAYYIILWVLCKVHDLIQNLKKKG